MSETWRRDVSAGAAAVAGDGAGAAGEVVPLHCGGARPEWMEFFAPPPAQVGRVLSAESTLKRGRRFSFSLTSRVVITGLAGVVAWVSMARFHAYYTSSEHGDPRVMGWVAAAVFVPLVWFLTRFKARCTYVG